MYAKNGILLVEDGNLVYTDKEMNDWQIIGQLAKTQSNVWYGGVCGYFAGQKDI